MSSLARALLALAAAALLHAGCCDAQCATVQGGSNGDYTVEILEWYLTQTDNLIDLPSDSCGWPDRQVGVTVTACDPFGRAPTVQLLDEDSRARISCTWTSGLMCPQGLDVNVIQQCNWAWDNK